MTTALVNPPFGRDLSCLDRILANRQVTGTRLLAEAMYRRLITERGSLENDPHYGFNISAWLNKLADSDDLQALPGLILAELRKDERLATIDVVVNSQRAGSSALTVTININAISREGVAFKTVMSANDVTVDLLSVQEAA